MLKNTTALIISLLAVFGTYAREQESPTFTAAKQNMQKIFRKLDNPTTLYCGCPISFPLFQKYRPDLEKCGYIIRFDEKRARRIEAEHIMPAWEFGHKMQCWKKGKRRFCSATSPEYSAMESDLHNLYPAIGEVNQDRSNFSFAQTASGYKNSSKGSFKEKKYHGDTYEVYNNSHKTAKIGNYGNCVLAIDTKRQRIVPPDRAKGIIARAYLYMHQQYQVELDDEHLNLFYRWNREFAPDSNECRRNTLIQKIQGNDNPFVTQACRLEK